MEARPLIGYTDKDEYAQCERYDIELSKSLGDKAVCVLASPNAVNFINLDIGLIDDLSFST